jgi:hypothetical protein
LLRVQTARREMKPGESHSCSGPPEMSHEKLAREFHAKGIREMVKGVLGELDKE